MSFHKRGTDALAASRLDYPVLLALLGVDARRSAEPVAKIGLNPFAGPCLVKVVMGRADWREAARRLGGRFATPASSGLRARTPRHTGVNPR